MNRLIAAQGHTSVILVLNMRRFIAEEQRPYFEALRGEDQFKHALQQWHETLQNNGQNLFTPLAVHQNHTLQAPEEIGFATGVFRRWFLEAFATPTYQFQKKHLPIDPRLHDNIQFRKLFLRALKRWEIFIRPTITGFFVFRFTFEYQSPRSLIQIARDVTHLQEPFDILSALKWRERKVNDPTLSPEAKERTRQSINALLQWLGHDGKTPLERPLLYYPLQWKLAMEIANLFIEVVQPTIESPKPEHGPIRLRPAPPSLSIPLHDSYVLYHFDRLFATPDLLPDQSKKAGQGTRLVEITPRHLRESRVVRNALTSLLEGTILSKEKEPQGEEEESAKRVYHFPTPRWSHADKLLQHNLASWSDEFCVFSPRGALIIPSKRWQHHHLAVATIPGATLQVSYRQYWSAIERLVEFVLETHLLTQLVERQSYDLLQEIANMVEGVREGMFEGDVQFDHDLKKLVAQAALLRRLAALAQSMGHTRLWTRAEYATQKAEALLQALGVFSTFEHIRHNIESINQAADHVDELYLADLAEKSNQGSTILSLFLSGLSLILALLALPSFWADLYNSYDNFFTSQPDRISWSSALYYLFIILGTLIGAVVIGFSLWLFVQMLRPAPRKRLREIARFLKETWGQRTETG